MKFSTPTILFAISSLTAAQGVTATISPSAPPPPGCILNHPSRFKLAVSPLDTIPSTAAKRAAADSCSNPSLLVLSLSNGILSDAFNRSGYIASNNQFQFDGPPQSGSLLTGGFSLCANGSLALGGSTVWYQCKSGNFNNLYDRNWAEQCTGIHLQAVECDGGDADKGKTNGSASPAALPICEIGDGQIQVHTTLCQPPNYTPEVTVTPSTRTTAGATVSSAIRSSTVCAASPTETIRNPVGTGISTSPISTSMSTSAIAIGKSTAPIGTGRSTSPIGTGTSTSTATATVATPSSTMTVISSGEKLNIGLAAAVVGVVAMMI